MLKPGVLLALFGLAFAYGIVHLFALRFQEGDVYPPYSSLRADPLGTKGFHDALDELPQLDVQRNYRAIRRLRLPSPPTLVYAGVPSHAMWGGGELRDVEGLLTDGARVVLAFFPTGRGLTETKAEKEKKKTEEKKDAATKSKKKDESTRSDKEADSPPADDAKDEDDDAGEVLSFEEVAERWGFAFDALPAQSSSARVALLQDATAAGLEQRLTWHSSLSFSPKADAWKVIYACEDEPVVIERKYNRGTIVLAADSFFLSNEALRTERSSALLAWLVGDSRIVVFDEESHNIRADPGVAHLVRKYHLHGLIAGLVVIAFLFVWKNASPLVPAFDDSERNSGAVMGKSSEEGFVNLLRRSIPQKEIVGLCVEEWRRAIDPRRQDARAAAVVSVAENEQSKPARERNPVKAYGAISRAVAENKLASSPSSSSS
jgi:hypothetical protein